MQKQKIDTTLYLVLQNTYEDIQVVLCNKDKLLGKKVIHKFLASKELVLSIDSLLKEHNFKLEDLTFIGVNKGPGPFTTLRVVVVTANALNFAGDLPLIGINGLEAFEQEYKDAKYPITAIMLNAYNNDVYYIISDESNNLTQGYANINSLLQDLHIKHFGKKIRFMGNAVDLFKKEIEELFKESLFIPNPNPQTCSIEQIAKIAYEKWKNKEDIAEQIMPLYMKDAVKLN